MAQSPKMDVTSKDDLKALVKPVSLLKLAATVVPGTAMLTEGLNQIHGERVERRLSSIEERVETHQRILKDTPSHTSKVPENWPAATASYVRRAVDILVFYNEGFSAGTDEDSELYHVIGHGAIVDDGQIITLSGVLRLATQVAEAKRGTVEVLIGLIRYGFKAEKVDPHSGLVILRLGNRNEEDFQDIQRRFEDMPQGVLNLTGPIKTPIKFSLTPWTGEEIGFFHECEDKDAMSQDTFCIRQLERTSVSYFLKPRDDRFKAFVTGILFERIIHAGAPVFNCEGQLLGLISNVKTSQDTPGLRAVVSSLVPHPHFMARIDRQRT